jgi:hypothetical protein
MQLRYLMAASALAAFVGLASPAMAANGNTKNTHNDNSSVANTHGGSAAAAGNGKSTVQGNGNNRGNTTTNNSGNNRDNVDVKTGDNNLDGFQANGNNRGNDTESMGNGSASKGGEVSDNGNNRDNGGNTSYGAGSVVADQMLSGVVVGHDEKDLVDNVAGYTSGNDSVRGNAFAAYAGILNQAWNTGIAANTQAGTNIAATGNVNFSSAGGDQANGAGKDSAD